jgi:hypothetical protein
MGRSSLQHLQLKFQRIHKAAHRAPKATPPVDPDNDHVAHRSLNRRNAAERSVSLNQRVRLSHPKPSRTSIVGGVPWEIKKARRWMRTTRGGSTYWSIRGQCVRDRVTRSAAVSPRCKGAKRSTVLSASRRPSAPQCAFS